MDFEKKIKMELQLTILNIVSQKTVLRANGRTYRDHVDSNTVEKILTEFINS